jgi:hypothetical protein
MADGFSIPEAVPTRADPEIKIWRSLDGGWVLIRVGYTDLELTADGAARLCRELAKVGTP